MITVFGLGFVGLTTALGFAHYGFKVYGVDVDEQRMRILRAGRLPFLEKGLDGALERNLNSNFIITEDAKEAIENSEVVFYCVGTPYGKNGEADLSFLFSAIDETLRYIDKTKKVVLTIKSTIPPSTTTERIIPYIESKGVIVGKDVYVANNPEFLREGHCWEDFIEADRIVIGTESIEAQECLHKIYEPFHIPVFFVEPSTGEFIKYLSNSLLATLISYSNEMAEVAEVIGGIDIREAFKILHMDKRWNGAPMSSYVYPGCGYGGYCLPKDTNALLAVTINKGGNPEILDKVIKTNNNMPVLIAQRIQKKVDINDNIGILGLSFKPGSNDVRDSASAKIVQELKKMGYQNIYAYDPVATQDFIEYYHIDITYLSDLDKICELSDKLIILTAWEEFGDIKIKYRDKTLDYRYM
jgi:UDPglucose 6-dehydrogenase